MSNPIALANPAVAAAQGGTNLRGEGGAAYVQVAGIGLAGANQDRQASAPGTTQASFTWATGAGPRKVRIRLKNGTSEDLVKVCFDAPSAALATLWLADDGTAATPRMYRVIHNTDTADANAVGDAGWTEFYFSDPLENIYYVGVGTLGAGTVLEVEAN